MKSKIAIFGSCVSMDNFRTAHNNYKDAFELSSTFLRLSLISIMQESIPFKEEEITILPDTPQHKFSTNLLRNDLNKNFFSQLNEDIEYLILDLYFDILFGILITDRGIITHNTWDYTNINFYKNLKEKKELSFNKNPYEYYVLWTKCCDKFFNYIQTNYPDMKIILNKVKIVDKIKDKNGEYYIEPLYTKRAVKLNPVLDMIEEYILSNYDVIFVDMTDNVTSDENHIWGKSLVHYNTEYYHNFYKVMIELQNGNTNKYFYEKNNVICQEKEIPKKYKHYKYKLRNIRNSNKNLDKVVSTIKQLIVR